RYFNVGAQLNRPLDRTAFYLGYRHIDPVDSRTLLGSVSYVFSAKYAMTAATAYDFGAQRGQQNTLVFTRMGTAVMVSFGVTYNAMVNNFGLVLEIVPNLMAGRSRGLGGSTSLMARPH